MLLRLFVCLLILVSSLNSGFCKSRLFLPFVQGEASFKDKKYITDLVMRETKKSGENVRVLRPIDFIIDNLEEVKDMSLYEMGDASRSEWVIGGKVWDRGRKGSELVLSLYNIKRKVISKQVEISYKNMKSLKRKLRNDFSSFRCSITGEDCIKEKLVRKIPTKKKKRKSRIKKKKTYVNKILRKKEKFTVDEVNFLKEIKAKWRYYLSFCFSILFSLFLTRELIISKSLNKKLVEENYKLKVAIFEDPRDLNKNTSVYIEF